MDAFTHSLLERGNLSEIECWHEIAHMACEPHSIHCSIGAKEDVGE